MNKAEILEKCYKPEDKLLVSKIFDKIEACRRKNIITHTDFLDMHQKSIIEKILKASGSNYFFEGGYTDATRKMAIVFPEKLTIDMIKEQLNSYIQIIRIELPENLHGKYMHKDYLSGIMKLGIKREKFGDIIVEQNGADIIVDKDIAEYLYSNLQQLTRFNKSKISIEKIEDIKQVEVKKEELRIVIQSLRLDSIVAQLANTSRIKAQEIICEGRVFINYEEQYKEDKPIKEKDIIVIRGKGKFEVNRIDGTTRKNKQILVIEKYV